MLKRRWLLPTLTAFLVHAPAGANSSVEFELRGVLISPSTRSALVNDQIAREGERVDGIEILAIEEDGVRVLSGTEHYTVPVGASAWLEPSSARVRSPQSEFRPVVRRVNSGDTLSGIAEDYAGSGVSLNQVMVALYEANPRAFDGNMNRLRAGAELRIPETREIRPYSPESALGEVLHQTEGWLAGQDRLLRVAAPMVSVVPEPTEQEANAEASEYGPVRFGETLSEIAVEVSADGVSMHRMMTALFEANPHAFGDNIDLLREGAVLRVPDFDEINRIQTLTASN